MAAAKPIQIPPYINPARLEILMKIGEHNIHHPNDGIYFLDGEIPPLEILLANQLYFEKLDREAAYEQCYIQNHAKRAQGYIDAILKMRDPENEVFNWDLAEEEFCSLAISVTKWRIYLAEKRIGTGVMGGGGKGEKEKSDGGKGEKGDGGKGGGKDKDKKKSVTLARRGASLKMVRSIPITRPHVGVSRSSGGRH